MALTKLYDRINWSDNTAPDINASNLNRMSKGLDDLDDRVIDIADTLMTTVPEIREDLAEAEELLEDAEAITTHPPIIGQNGNWWTWDTEINDYADSGVDAGVSVSVGTTTTLSPGSNATVTNSGTDTDPILNFGIPQGTAGQNGQDGAPGVGVPSGGTTGQVLKKVSGTDYDTEWANESGGGGHTILNSSGTAMTSRSNLQFSGISVKDDSTNDKTVVEIPQFTQAEWDNLSSAQKAAYNGCQVIIKDDYGQNSVFLDSVTLNTTSGATNPESQSKSVTIDVSDYSKIYSVVEIKGGNGQVANLVSMGIIDISVLASQTDDISATVGSVYYSSSAIIRGSLTLNGNISSIKGLSIVGLWYGYAVNITLKIYGIK